MAKIILTSNGIDSNEIEAEFKKYINDKTKVCIIITAKEKERKKQAIVKNKNLFEEVLKTKSLTFIDLETDSAEKLLDFDFIFLLGGNPFKLMYFLKKSKAKAIFEKMLNHDKVIAGASAGSMVLGSNMGVCNYLAPEMNKSWNLKEFSGLGLTEINICPHCNTLQSRFENGEEKISKFCTEQKRQITNLCDGEALIIDTKNNMVKKIKGLVIPGR